MKAPTKPTPKEALSAKSSEPLPRDILNIRSADIIDKT
jgi:hypothetical protein